MVYQNPIDSILHETLLTIGFRPLDDGNRYFRYVDRQTGRQTPREVRVIPGQTPYAMKHIVLSEPVPELEEELRIYRLHVLEGADFPVNGGKKEWPSRLVF